MAEVAIIGAGASIATWLLLRGGKKQVGYLYFPNGASLTIKNRAVVGRYTILTAGYPPEVAKYVSRLHFEIFKDKGRFYIRDLGSKNFTYLNGRRLRCFRQYLLKNGDQISLANVLTLTFILG